MTTIPRLIKNVINIYINMGTTESKVKRYSDIFIPLRVCSFYVDIDSSINKRRQINSLVDYYMKGYHNYELDILCLQGIRKYDILKEIICRFKKKVISYNEMKNKGYDSAIYLEYFPDIAVDRYMDHDDDADFDWSDDDTDNPIYYDKLIISRYPILRSTNEPFNRNLYIHDTAQSTMNNSEFIDPNSDYLQVVNFNIEGAYLSIYNVELKEDNIGTNNTRERKRQIYEIRRIIDRVREDSKEKKMRIYDQGDDRYIAYNRDLHIVTGMFHINDTKNDRSNAEYMTTLRILKAFDVHSWIRSLKKDRSANISNVRYTKDSYILMCTDNFNSTDAVSAISYKMYQYHKLIIINATIPTNLIDLGFFTNYPLDAIFMLFRPTPEPYDPEKDNKKIDERRHINSLESNLVIKLVNEPMDEIIENHMDRVAESEKNEEKEERMGERMDNASNSIEMECITKIYNKQASLIKEPDDSPNKLDDDNRSISENNR